MPSYSAKFLRFRLLAASAGIASVYGSACGFVSLHATPRLPMVFRLLCPLLALVCALALDTVGQSAERPLNFENDIVPILSRFGCNSSDCYGKAEGQNGFKLSVFGFDPPADCVVGECRHSIARIGDAGDMVLAVVGIAGDRGGLAAGPVGVRRGDAGHAVESVVSRGVDLALMVRDGLLNDKNLHVPNQLLPSPFPVLHRISLPPPPRSLGKVTVSSFCHPSFCRLLLCVLRGLATLRLPMNGPLLRVVLAGRKHARFSIYFRDARPQ